MNISNQSPIVSVLIIAYNQEKYISEALEGALMQKTTFSYQIVISEDSSTDSTRKICEHYAKTFPNKIKLLSLEQNLGMINNFIRGFMACTGKYIALCEGDDYWIDENKLQKQVSFLERNSDYSICAHEPKLVFERGVPKKVPFYNKPNEGSFTFTFQDQFENHFIPTASIVFQSKYNTELIEFIKDKIVGDIPVVLFLLTKGKGYYFEEKMSVKRRNLGGITFNEERKDGVFWGMYKLWEDVHSIAPLEMKNISLKRLAGYDRALLKNAYRNKKILKMFEHLFKAIVRDPFFFFNK